VDSRFGIQQNRVIEILAKIRSTERGSKILSEIERGDRRVIITPEYSNYPNYQHSKEGNSGGTIYFNPNDVMGIDVEYKDGKTGRINASAERIMAHELGHAFGTGDEGPGSMDNINENENEIMSALGEKYRRTKYDGQPNKGWKSPCKNPPTEK